MILTEGIGIKIKEKISAKIKREPAIKNNKKKQAEEVEYFSTKKGEKDNEKK